MVLSLLYTVWTGDDMEMLKASIIQHSPNVDRIYICWQSISNKGEYWTINGLSHIRNAVGIETAPIMFIPDLEKSTKENERIKHDMMIQQAKQDGCTHFIMSACDHFYTDQAFEIGKKDMIDHDYDVSFTKMITYYKDPAWALWPLEDYYMPFIHKMNEETRISAAEKYPVRVDPSVKVIGCVNFRIYRPYDIVLHHHSMIRQDIKRKFRNAASSVRWTQDQVNTFEREYEAAKLGDKITYFHGREIMEAEKVLRDLDFMLNF